MLRPVYERRGVDDVPGRRQLEGPSLAEWQRPELLAGHLLYCYRFHILFFWVWVRVGRTFRPVVLLESFHQIFIVLVGEHVAILDLAQNSLPFADCSLDRVQGLQQGLLRIFVIGFQ